MDSTIDSIVWGKWIALGCLVAAVITLVICIRYYSIRRMRMGHQAIPGTAWLVPPRYTPAVTDREGLPQVAAPPYNPHVGEQDAGFYDKDGNFIARPLAPPEPAHAFARPEHEEIMLEELPGVGGGGAGARRQAPLEPQPSAPPSFRSHLSPAASVAHEPARAHGGHA